MNVVQAPNEDKSDDTEGGFYEEMGRVFDQFLAYHIRSSLHPRYMEEYIKTDLKRTV
jgi:hypothetical protein